MCLLVVVYVTLFKFIVLLLLTEKFLPLFYIKAKSSSLLPFLEFVLGYSKVPMAASEQRLNLCVCPLTVIQGNT